MEIGGACRLTAMNLFSFVRNPFTQDAYFDFDKFRESVRIGQRIMDDIVQLDIEKIEEIIEKVKSDDEPDSIKHHELSLWNNILDHAKESRRTGLGLTALGDMFAGLGIRYGSEESREFIEKASISPKSVEPSTFTTTAESEAIRLLSGFAKTTKSLFKKWKSTAAETLPFSLSLQPER